MVWHKYWYVWVSRLSFEFWWKKSKLGFLGKLWVDNDLDKRKNWTGLLAFLLIRKDRISPCIYASTYACSRYLYTYFVLTWVCAFYLVSWKRLIIFVNCIWFVLILLILCNEVINSFIFLNIQVTKKVKDMKEIWAIEVES